MTVKLEESGSDILSEQQKTVSEIEETAETAPIPVPLPFTTTRHGDISATLSTSRKVRALPAPAFAYGLQPFKVILDTAPGKEYLWWAE